MKNKKSIFNKYLLFSTPSFVSGMASVVDLLGLLNRNNLVHSSNIIDRKAFETDWEIIGKDFTEAIYNFKERINE